MQGQGTPAFIVFQGRLMGTSHIVTLAPPRPEGGKQIIEVRVVGGLAYVEEHHHPDDAAARYAELTAILLGGVASAAASPLEAVPEPEGEGDLAEVMELPARGALL